MNKHTSGPLDREPDNQTIQQCCICYGGSSFSGPMEEALKCHLSILKSKYPLLKAAPELLEACKESLKWFSKLAADHDGDYIAGNVMRHHAAVSAIIAKAEGR